MNITVIKLQRNNITMNNKTLINFEDVKVGDILDIYEDEFEAVERVEIVDIFKGTAYIPPYIGSFEQIWYKESCRKIYRHNKTTNTNNMQKEITKKIYGKNKSSVRGYFVARKTHEGKLAVGYSLCRKEDKFDKKAGLNIARSRSVELKYIKNVPVSIRLEFAEFMVRAQKFFKDATI